MIKIISVIGARPQFIKSAPLSKYFKASNINEIIIHTGQHYDPEMSKIFFDQLNIPKEKYNLGINQLSHGAMTGRMIEKIEEILLIEKPDFILVYGDTNSTLAAAIAAVKHHIKIIHVEAGLRSFNRKMPEEINRVLTDNISDILFCPSAEAVKNLYQEGINEENAIVSVVGDVMKDAIALFSKNNSPYDDDMSDILVTVHREENITSKEKLSKIVNGLNALSEEYNLIFPLHPSTKKRLQEHNLKLNFKISKPFGFLEMIRKIKGTGLVITDSGGLQKEAYYLEKPSLIIRDQTEWVELLQDNVNTLCPTNSDMIINQAKIKLDEKYNFQRNIYGNDVSNKIIEIIKKNHH